MTKTSLSRPRVSVAARARAAGGTNAGCHSYTGAGLASHDKRVLKRPKVVPIYWDQFFIANPDVVTEANKLLHDLVRGPFMNGLAQYGVGRGTIAKEIVIDTNATPVPATPWDSGGNADAVQLTKWLLDGVVTPEPEQNQLSLMFVIFLPLTLTLTNGKDNAGVPVTDICGWHDHSRYNEGAGQDDLFWAVISTNSARQTSSHTFVDDISFCVGHELAEAFTNPSEDGYFDTNCELGDICEVDSSGALATFNYRGWHVEPYWSNWDRACIQGDNPVSLKRFFQAIGFDKTKGLRALGTSTINVDFIASKM